MHCCSCCSTNQSHQGSRRYPNLKVSDQEVTIFEGNCDGEWDAALEKERGATLCSECLMEECTPGAGHNEKRAGASGGKEQSQLKWAGSSSQLIIWAGSSSQLIIWAGSSSQLIWAGSSSQLRWAGSSSQTNVLWIMFCVLYTIWSEIRVFPGLYFFWAGTDDFGMQEIHVGPIISLFTLLNNIKIITYFTFNNFSLAEHGGAFL